MFFISKFVFYLHKFDYWIIFFSNPSEIKIPGFEYVEDLNDTNFNLSNKTINFFLLIAF